MSFPLKSKISLSLSNQSENYPKRLIANQKFCLIKNKTINKDIIKDKKDIDDNLSISNLKTSFSHNHKQSFSTTDRRIKVKTISTNTQTQFDNSPKKYKLFSKVNYTNLYKGRKYIPKFTNIKTPRILNNEFLKTHFFTQPQNLKNFHVKSNFIKFQNINKKYIVKDDISLLGILQNQTNSNFNNKYELKYWTNSKKKKEQIKRYFNLIKKGMNLNDIDNMLNGPKELITYNIQTSPNEKSKMNFDIFHMKSIRERKNNYNLTVNTLEHIRPLSTFNSKMLKSNY